MAATAHSICAPERRAVMARAWALFTEIYHFPRVPFRSIGRACFASCLKNAWVEARKAARIAAIPADVRKAQLEEAMAGLECELEAIQYKGSRFDYAARARAIRTELKKLREQLEALAPAPVQTPTEYRAFQLFDALPQGCITVPVTDERSAPHLKMGEFAVVDTTDREPQHGEVFLVEWSSGRRTIQQAVARKHTNDGGEFIGWWTRNLAVGQIPSALKRAMFDDIIAGRTEDKKAGAFLSLCVADGPRKTEGFREALVGRVIGVLAPSEPKVLLVRGGARG